MNKILENKKGSVLILAMIIILVISGMTGSLLYSSSGHNNLSKVQSKKQAAYYVAYSGLNATVIACNKFKDELIMEIHGNMDPVYGGWDTVIVRTENGWKDLNGDDSSAWSGEKARVFYDSTHDEAGNELDGGKLLRNRRSGDFEVYLTKNNEHYYSTSSGVYKDYVFGLSGKMEYKESETTSKRPRNAGDKKIIFGGNGFVKSVDPNNPNVYNESIFATNGNVEITGNFDYYGEIHPGPGKEILFKPKKESTESTESTEETVVEDKKDKKDTTEDTKKATIIPPTGKTLEEATAPLTENFTLEPVKINWPTDVSVEYDKKVTGQATETWTGTKYFSSSSSADAFSMTGGTITIQGDVTAYFDGDFHFGGNGNLEIPRDSSLTIYCSGVFKINGGSVNNATNDPEKFNVKVSYESPSYVNSEEVEESKFKEDVFINGNSVTHVILYAPRANARINGTADFVGNIAAYMLLITGTADFYDKVNDDNSEQTTVTKNYFLSDSNMIKAPIRDVP